MIFVTVGTHEQAFNRLLIELDKLKSNKIINEEIIVQSGYTAYKMKFCKQYDFISFENLKDYIRSAHIVVTHGGPASFIEVLQTGKIPVVVPRQKKYDEHVNNHQIDFVKKFNSKSNLIIPVYNIARLGDIFLSYDKVISSIDVSDTSNNAEFNEKLIDVIDHLLEKR